MIHLSSQPMNISSHTSKAAHLSRKTTDLATLDVFLHFQSLVYIKLALQECEQACSPILCQWLSVLAKHNLHFKT